MDEKKTILKWKIIASVLLIACIIVVGFLVKEKIEGFYVEKAVNKAIDYINDHLSNSNGKASLKSIGRGDIDLGKAYKFTLEIDGSTTDAYVTLNGKYLISSLAYLDQQPSPDSTTDSDKNQVDSEGGFKEMTDVDICYESDKPIIYFFGLTTSEDSVWEYPIFKDVVSKFKDDVSFHDNNLSENGLTKDQDIFLNYNNTGAVPTLIIGCKYYRIGSGKDLGETKEKEVLTKLICDATGNKPESLCK